MGLKRVSWVRRYQGQCRALRFLGHQGCRLRNHNKDQPLCSGYTGFNSRSAQLSRKIPCDMAVTLSPHALPPQHIWDPKQRVHIF